MSTRVLPGCEPFRFDGGSTGVLLLHGFTGNPSSMRPLGQFLSEHGYSVVGPRYPGHGTSWEELATTSWQDWSGEAAQALEDLSARTDDVAVVALSFGGCVAIHLATTTPDRIRAVGLVNPYVVDRRLAAVPLARLFARSRKGVGNDIKKPAQNETPYERVPFAALAQVARFQKLAQSELPSMRQPLIVFHSPQDHVVPKGNAEFVIDHAGSAEKELVLLPNSYHVATLDYDAETLQDRILGFIQSHTGA